MHSLLATSGPLLLGALPAHPRLSESLPYQLNGLAVVFIALGLIWLVLEALGFYFKRTAPAPVAEAPAPAAAAPAVAAKTPVPAPAPDSLTPELVAVITACVRMTLEKDFRIQAIVPVPSGQDWAHEGRRQIFASHQVR